MFAWAFFRSNVFPNGVAVRCILPTNDQRLFAALPAIRRFSCGTLCHRTHFSWCDESVHRSRLFGDGWLLSCCDQYLPWPDTVDSCDAQRCRNIPCPDLLRCAAGAPLV